MNQGRAIKINGIEISEYVVSGRFIVYIDGRLSDMSFDKACRYAMEGDNEDQNNK